MRKLILLLVCLVFVKTGTSIKCYVCGSVNEHYNYCTDPFDESKLTLDTCDIPKAVCLKERVPATDGYRENVLRGCVQATYCEETEDRPSHCSTCEEDGCNVSSFLAPSYITLVVFVLFNIICNKLEYVRI